MQESKREQARKQGRVGEQPESISQKRRGGKKITRGDKKGMDQILSSKPTDEERCSAIQTPQSSPHAFLAAGLAEG